MNFQKLQPVLEEKVGKFSQNLIIKTISQGMVRLFPLMAVGSLMALLSNLGIPAFQKFIEDTGLMNLLKLGTRVTMGLVSIYIVVALSYEMASQLHKNKIAAILLSFMSFFLVTPLKELDVNGQMTNTIDLSYLSTKGIFVAMMLSMTVTWFYSYASEKDFGFKKLEALPPNARSSFAALIPGFIIGLLSLVINKLFSVTPFGNIYDFIYAIIQSPLGKLGSSIFVLFFLLFFSEVLWFFGIHGSTTISTMLFIVYFPLDIQNIMSFTNGTGIPNAFTKTFIESFKGPRHLALALVLLYVCKSKQLRAVGKVAIKPAFFGISEPMKFGIPMILNPVIFIPMTLAPVMNVSIAYLFTITGLMPKVRGIDIGLPLPFVGGVINTGSWVAILVSLLQLVCSFLLYLPFIKYLDKQMIKKESL